MRINCVNTSEVFKLKPGSKLSLDRYWLFLSRFFLSSRPHGDLRNYEFSQLITSTTFHPVTLHVQQLYDLCTSASSLALYELVLAHRGSDLLITPYQDRPFQRPGSLLPGNMF